MTIHDLLIGEIAGNPEPILAEVYHYLRCLKNDQIVGQFNGLIASHSALGEDWDSTVEDAAWTNL